MRRNLKALPGDNIGTLWTERLREEGTDWEKRKETMQHAGAAEAGELGAEQIEEDEVAKEQGEAVEAAEDQVAADVVDTRQVKVVKEREEREEQQGQGDGAGGEAEQVPLARDVAADHRALAAERRAAAAERRAAAAERGAAAAKSEVEAANLRAGQAERRAASAERRAAQLERDMASRRSASLEPKPLAPQLGEDCASRCAVLEKRPLNAYQLWMSDFRRTPDFQSLLGDNDRSSFHEVSKHCGNLWKAMSEVARAPYMAAARQQSADYQEAKRCKHDWDALLGRRAAQVCHVDRRDGHVLSVPLHAMNRASGRARFLQLRSNLPLTGAQVQQLATLEELCLLQSRSGRAVCACPRRT